MEYLRSWLLRLSYRWENHVTTIEILKKWSSADQSICTRTCTTAENPIFSYLKLNINLGWLLFSPCKTWSPKNCKGIRITHWIHFEMRIMRKQLLNTKRHPQKNKDSCKNEIGKDHANAAMSINPQEPITGNVFELSFHDSKHWWSLLSK